MTIRPTPLYLTATLLRAWARKSPELMETAQGMDALRFGQNLIPRALEEDNPTTIQPSVDVS